MRSWTAALLLVVVGTIAYWNGLSAPFMFDDENSVVANQQIRQLWPLSGPLSPPRDTPVAARPLPNLTLAVDYAVHGTDVRGYHVVNLAIHLLAAILLFAVLRLTLERVGARSSLAAAAARPRGKQKRASPPPAAAEPGPFARDLAAHATILAFVGALVWTVHPLNSEVIDYVSQRTESLMACAYLLTMYCAIRAAVDSGRSTRWAVGAVAACAAGMACKESMVTAPIVVALYDRAFLFDSWRAAWRRRSTFYGWLGATWILLAAIVSSGGRTSAGLSAVSTSSNTVTTPWLYLLNQAQIVAHYLRLVVWPRGLVLDYGLPRTLTLPDVIVPGLLVVAAVAVAAFALVRWPRAGFAGAWFFITLAPTSSFIPIATEVGAERRMYLPLMALVALAVVALYRAAWRIAGGRRALVATTAVGVLIAGAATTLTVARNGEYVSRLTMARTIVERWPSGRGHFLLAYELMSANREDDALAELRESIRAGYIPGHYALGVELATVSRYSEAANQLGEFIRLMPQSPVVIPARELLGRILYEEGQYDAAEQQFTLILQAVPTHAMARQYLAVLHARPRRN